MIAWTLIALAAPAYCLVRRIVGLRQRNYVWGALGLLSAAALLFTPVQTHAVRMEFPAPATQ